MKKYLKATLLAFLLALVCSLVWAGDYTDTEIVNAIFLAEGGEKATYKYGIRSVKYKDEAEARQICYNTVRNNRKRYADYGYKEYPDYLSFLQSRYAPTKNCDNDPKGLNRHWLKNVKYFLENPK